MSTVATSPNAAFALQRALAGRKVLPLCWPDAAGACACPGEWNPTLKRTTPHQGKDVGKAPIGKLAPNGWKSASNDPETVLNWWSEFPNANVGESVESNGYLVVDPDSPEALAEAHKFGLSPTIIRHSRNTAFIYQRPPDCPATSVKRAGKSGALDILADGYVVTFGTHQNGTAISLEGETIAPAPRWPVEWLQQASGERQRKREAAAARIAGGDDDEPPVYLGEPDSYAMKVWRGELVKRKENGQVERSGSLVKIGRVLYDAGATKRTITQALAERDEALGWRKYTGRPDADQQYHDIFAELESKGRNPKAWPEHRIEPSAPTNGNGNGNGHHPEQPGGCCPGCTCGCSRALIAERRLEQIKAALANPGLDAGPKLVIIGAILELERRENWKPSALERHTGVADGYRIVSLERLASGVGMVDRTVSRHLKTAEHVGLLQRKEVGLPRGAASPLTGEVLDGPRKYTALRLPGSADDAMRALATVETASGWGGPGLDGGRREKGVCLKHPFAGTVEKARRTLHCEVCNDVLAQSVQVVLTDESQPLSTLPSVVIGSEQVVRTGATTGAERRRQLSKADEQADRIHADELEAGLGRLRERGRAKPEDPDEDLASVGAPAEPPPSQRPIWWAQNWGPPS